MQRAHNLVLKCENIREDFNRWKKFKSIRVNLHDLDFLPRTLKIKAWKVLIRRICITFLSGLTSDKNVSVLTGDRVTYILWWCRPRVFTVNACIKFSVNVCMHNSHDRRDSLWGERVQWLTILIFIENGEHLLHVTWRNQIDVTLVVSK